MKAKSVPTARSGALTKKYFKTNGPLAVIGTSFLVSVSSVAAEIVTVDNFVRAETDTMLARYSKQGAFGQFLHIR